MLLCPEKVRQKVVINKTKPRYESYYCTKLDSKQDTAETAILLGEAMIIRGPRREVFGHSFPFTSIPSQVWGPEILFWIHSIPFF